MHLIYIWLFAHRFSLRARGVCTKEKDRGTPSVMQLLKTPQVISEPSTQRTSLLPHNRSQTVRIAQLWIHRCRLASQRGEGGQTEVLQSCIQQLSMVLVVENEREQWELTKHHQTVEILSIGDIVGLLESHESRISDLATILITC